MKRSGAVKFPHSVELFRFCQKVLLSKKNGKVHDQEVGAILNFNPSDCSHWKRGEKNVKSVFALAQLADSLEVETTLLHDVAGGLTSLDEAFFEYKESLALKSILKTVSEADPEALKVVRKRVFDFVRTLHASCEFSTPPLYLPEVMRFFPFIKTQQADMVDKLSRILRVRPGRYTVHFCKGELRSQTRMSMTKDLARIIFQGERTRYPELGAAYPELSEYEQLLFTATILVPRNVFMSEMAKLDARRNVVSEVASLFWVPKILIGFQLQDMLRDTRPLLEVTADQSLAARQVNVPPNEGLHSAVL